MVFINTPYKNKTKKGYVMKNNSTPENKKNPEESEFNLPLDILIQEGARKIMQAALEYEIKQHLEKYAQMTDEAGKQLVTRNGYMPERDIVSGAGKLKIKRPRVDDRTLPENQRFTSKILPKYLRRTPSIDNLLPTLYLKGISTNDFSSALSAILGEGAKGLSASTIVRLKSVWEQEYNKWSNRDLSDKKYVYFWVDGIYFNVRLDDA